MKEGWKYEPLGSVGEFKRGGNFKKSDFVENGMPCVHYGQIHMRFGAQTTQHLSEIPQSLFYKCTKAQKGDLLIAITSEDVEGSCKCTAWLGNYEVALGGHMARFRHTLNPEYVSYYFQSPRFQQAKTEFTHGFKVIEIKPSDIAKITIPYPSLEEQSQIVTRIKLAYEKIDEMYANAKIALQEAETVFKYELESLSMRKDGWTVVRIADIATKLYRGAGIKRDQVKKSGIQCVRYGEIYTTYNYSFSTCISATDEAIIDQKKYFEHGDILFAITGESVEEIGKCVAYIGNAKCLAGGDILVMHHNQEPRYLAYALSTKDAIHQKGAGKTKLKVVHTNAASIQEITINLPPLEEQCVIADKLDSLADKISQLKENINVIASECDILKKAILKQSFE